MDNQLRRMNELAGTLKEFPSSNNLAKSPLYNDFKEKLDNTISKLESKKISSDEAYQFLERHFNEACESVMDMGFALGYDEAHIVP